MKNIINSLFLFSSLALLSQVTLLGQFGAENGRRSLFSDMKAMKPGDALTVLILEDIQADNSAATIDEHNNQLTLGVGASIQSLSGNADVSIGTGNVFRGRGATSRNERLRAKFSVRVDSVDKSGNLIVSGKRMTKINGENQNIILTGVIRPVDVQSDNTVFSYNILELGLSYDGSGTVTRANEPGLITKFLQLLF